MSDYNTVLNFWFEQLTPEDWFKKSDELDKLIADKFESTYYQILSGELASWRSTAHGVLAQVIVLDQFSRNMFRGSPKSFAQDPLALAIAQDAVANKLDYDLAVPERAFLYMPYMHSESKIIHLDAIKLFDQKGMEVNLDFEVRHKAIIDRFGRYPHRNEVLGRISTSEEVEFLKEPGSSF